jgi:hypothetical protein
VLLLRVVFHTNENDEKFFLNENLERQKGANKQGKTENLGKPACVLKKAKRREEVRLLGDMRLCEKSSFSVENVCVKTRFVASLFFPSIGVFALCVPCVSVLVR